MKKSNVLNLIFCIIAIVSLLIQIGLFFLVYDDTYRLFDIVNVLDEMDCEVNVILDSEVLEDYADEFDLYSAQIKAIIVTKPRTVESGILGCFIICDNTRSSKRVEEQLIDFLDEDDEFRESIEKETVERFRAIAFIGTKDIWIY